MKVGFDQTDQTLAEHLQTLNLSGIPNQETLQQNFARLLKLYHPDRNRQRLGWANERTHQLVLSWNWLKDYLHLKKQQEAIHTKHKSNGIQFQLIEGADKNYAIPVDAILKIMSFDSPDVKKSIFGYYCMYENQTRTLTGIDGKPVRHDRSLYVVLLTWEEDVIGIVIPFGMKFGSIIDFIKEEMVRHHSNLKSATGWMLFSRRKSYLFPEGLLENSRQRQEQKSSKAPC